MKKIPIAIQLYSLREQAKNDFPAVLKRVATLGCKAVEFAGLHDLKPVEVRKIIDDLGMICPSCLGPFPEEGTIREIVETAKALGIRYHVGGLKKDLFATEDLCLKSAERFQKGAELLKKEGLRFALHNHWTEFDHEFNGKTPHEIVMEKAPDLFAELDTYWVALAGKNPAKVLENLGNRAPLLHIKDGPIGIKEDMTAVGEGKMEWPPLFAAVEKSAAEYLVIELDRCATDMFEAIKKSVSFLENSGIGICKS